ncbi:MAG: hypothetical protein V4585_10100 [Bacteroidota bacterium]
MKNVVLIFLLAISCSTFAQTIRRCNNNPGVSGVNVYTTIQAAHDAAVAGDIIYVEPSVTDYGSVDVRKRLTIIGNGYNIDKNTNVPFEPRTSKIVTITFNNGSANSVITGVDLSGAGTNVNDVNITITRCKTNVIGFGASSNLVAGVNSRGNNATITKCLITGSISGSNSTNVASQYGYNCTITNNIQQGSSIGSITNTVIASNIYNLQGISNVMNNLNGCSVTNNIYDARGFTATIPFVTSGAGNTISNNICLGQAGTPSGNGNVNFGDETTTFLVANPWLTFPTEDAKFQLAVGSPAIGIGTGGTNAGAFGGANPYILSGLPAYPVMTNFTTTGVGNTTTPLQVSVTVRGNN